MDRSISKSSLVFSLFLCFIEIPVFNVNSVDPDQTPQNAASDLGLHCLPVTLLGLIIKLKWVNALRVMPEIRMHPFTTFLLCLRTAGWVANSADPDQKPQKTSTLFAQDCPSTLIYLNTAG